MSLSTATRALYGHPRAVLRQSSVAIFDRKVTRHLAIPHNQCGTFAWHERSTSHSTASTSDVLPRSSPTQPKSRIHAIPSSQCSQQDAPQHTDSSPPPSTSLQQVPTEPNLSGNGLSSTAVAPGTYTGNDSNESNDEFDEEEELILATSGEDTIAAIVTGPASQGTVSIIRVSGTDALEIAARVFRPGGKFRFNWRPVSHRVYYGTAVDLEERVLDEVLLLPMLCPRSYTREDVVELHCHGGGVCASRVLRSCIEAGARIARPGEFTMRAFLNGRLDLSQAENIEQLLNARTPAAADSALAGLQGGLGGAVRDIRDACVGLLVELEARIDFEDDLPDMDVLGLSKQLDAAQLKIEAALRTARQGSLLRQGLQVAIVGRPNVGKSSLLNAWTRTNRSIVTDIAGTTRDVVEAGLVVGGVPVTLLDTAGIRQSGDTVEKIGVERSEAAATSADIVMMVVDSAAGWTEEDTEIFKQLWGNGAGSKSCKVKGLSLLVANKADLTGEDAKRIALPVVVQDAFQQVVVTSATTRQGLEDLDSALLGLAGAPQLASGGVSWAVNERQAEALVRAHEALMKVGESVRLQLPIDFWTIDLRTALIALGEVTGDEITEEILDNIFSKFCIGK